MKTLYANHPKDVERYNTTELREHFLMEEVFTENVVNLTYSHVDRIIFGGAMPTTQTLKLEAAKELAATYFLERREMGVINIGGDGIITVDGEKHEINARDAIYIGRGSKDIEFASNDPKNPAKFYINSCPAHKEYPTRKITKNDAKRIEMGDQETINKRVINQYIHVDVCDSCQLAMGLTELLSGNSWNTMPSHTHERRMEVYFYFDMKEDTRIFHLMGKPDETRHIVMKNEQAVLSPSWSIHSGVGTSNYTFIWGMCGENQDYTDMDHIAMKDLR